jgi:hypothetical protein
VVRQWHSAAIGCPTALAITTTGAIIGIADQFACLPAS